MKNKKLKIIISLSLILFAIIFILVGFKAMVLNDDENISEAKSIRRLSAEEEEKIFAIDEKGIEEEKIEMTSENADPITVTKTVEYGSTDDFYEGQIKTYTIKIKNNTNEIINNITVTDDIPKELVYVTEKSRYGYANTFEENEGTTQYTKEIEELKANETVELDYSVKVKKQETIPEEKIGTKAKAVIKGNGNSYESNLVQNNIKKGKIQIEFIGVSSSGIEYSEGNIIIYMIKVRNMTDGDLNNVKINYKVPQEADYSESIYLQYGKDGDRTYIYEDLYNPIINENYNESERLVTWDIDELNVGEEKAVAVKILLKPIETEERKLKIINSATVIVGDERYESNKYITNQVDTSSARVKMTVNPEKTEFYEGDIFEYIVTVTPYIYEQEGPDGELIIPLDLKETLPQGLTGISIVYFKEGKEEEASELSFSNEAKVTFSLAKDEKMIIKIKVQADLLEEGITEKRITNQVVTTGMEMTTETSNEVSVIIKKKQASEGQEPGQGGNNPGQGDNNNPGQGGNNPGQGDNNNPGGQGDNNNPGQGGNNNQGQGDNNNDDEAQNVSNKFDLKLDKYVNRILVKNQTGTYEYKYDDAKLAKVELDRKTLNNTTVMIEYKIRITNEGNSAGYVKQITDYLPQNLEFNSEVNKNWYKTGEKLENSELGEYLINPGQSKEITLTLTKKIANNEINTIENSAEIGESISKDGTKDKDSIGKNKKENEDDFSTATVILSIKTGKALQYTVLAITIILIIILGIYEIKKRVLKE